MFVEVFVNITSYNDVMSMVVFQVYFMKLIYALLIFDLVLASISWHIHTSDINFVAKAVDINDPLLPVSLPRGYGGFAILWKKTLITLSEPYQTAPKKSNVLNLKVQREM
jgi:hypothetical protein